jgi:hypothetical protein
MTKVDIACLSLIVPVGGLTLWGVLYLACTIAATLN